MSPASGRRLGPYEITAPLGAGGMGEVYRATDTKLGRDVAIKVLPAEVAREIYLLTPGEKSRLFEKDASVPAYSPDGRWIAYMSPASGNTNVFVRSVGGQGKWQVSSELGGYPRWSGDGRELFYLAPGTPQRPLMAVAVANDASFRAGPPRLLVADLSRYMTATAPQLDWDVAPAGDRFVFIETERAKDEGTRIDIALHWARHLATASPGPRSGALIQGAQWGGQCVPVSFREMMVPIIEMVSVPIVAGDVVGAGDVRPEAAEPGAERGRVSRRRARAALRFGLGTLWASAWVSGFALSDPQGGGAGTTQRTVSPIRFEDRQREAGIQFVLDNATTADKPVIDAVLGGVAVLDFDGDGRLDVFFTNGARIPGLTKDDPRFWNRLYRNQGDGTYRDVTERAGVRGEGYSMGAAAADFDNDGWTDLYVTSVNRNLLYHNERDGTFSDVTERAGVSGTGAGGKKLWSVGAAWLDYDKDGDLDLFVANYLDWSPENNRVCGMEGKRLNCSPTQYQGLPNLLYRNDGAGRFTDVSAPTGIGAHIGTGMSVAVADADGDGFTDIFVANDQMRHFLFRNAGGRTFHEIAVEAAVAYTEDGVPISGMGTDFRDVNEDGRPDIFVTALSGEAFPLYLNTAEGLFSDATHWAGLGYATIMMSGWGTGAYDFDNDGHKELFIANSHLSENIDLYGDHRYRQPNALFRGVGDGRFRDVTADAGAAMQRPRAHRGCAFGDLDDDGRVDIVVSVIGEPAEILFGVTADAGHWLELQLEGTKSNRDGIGARVKLTGESGGVQYNHATTAVGYASSSDKRVHFGLGADRSAREIEILWPSGTTQILKDVTADRLLKVKEP